MNSDSKIKLEKRMMNLSLCGSIAFVLVEAIMAYVTHSHSLLMDCIFDITDLVMIGPFLLLVPLLYRPVTERRPYGFSQVESLFLVVKYIVLLVITLQLIWDNIKYILHGGHEVDAGQVAFFELGVFAGCLVVYCLLYYYSRRYASVSIQAEILKYSVGNGNLEDELDVESTESGISQKRKMITKVEELKQQFKKGKITQDELISQICELYHVEDYGSKINYSLAVKKYQPEKKAAIVSDIFSTVLYIIGEDGIDAEKIEEIRQSVSAKSYIDDETWDMVEKAFRGVVVGVNVAVAADYYGNVGKVETSYGKSSGKLNWDAIVSKKGETRVDHINRHAVPNNSRETHGVFNGNPIDMVNDAWEQRHLVEPISDGMGGTIYNIPYKNAGYESGYINTGAQMDYITIVTLDESTDLITAFPSFGDYHK